jgi:hypothetical protein
MRQPDDDTSSPHTTHPADRKTSTMNQNLLAASASLLACLPAMAALPMGLKCDPSIKIVAAEVGQVGTYEVQKGMQKEQHSALINRKSVTPVNSCSVEQELAPGKVVVARYTGPEVSETEVQCIDLANNNAAVVFPKSIHTVRVPNLSPYMLMPYCPDGNASDGVACSKLGSQSERGSEYRDTVMKWKANDPKTKQYKIDLQFDPAYVSKAPPYTPSVPPGAKLFCAAINKKGEVVLAGTVQYPAAAAAAQSEAQPGTDRAARSSGATNTPRGSNGPVEGPAAASDSSPAAAALGALGRLRKP